MNFWGTIPVGIPVESFANVSRIVLPTLAIKNLLSQAIAANCILN